MINRFKYYLASGKAKRKTADWEEAKALVEKAAKRIEYAKGRSINEETVAFVLEDAYEAIRESAQALMSIKGFKPYSHEATISFIKEFYKTHFREHEIAAFNRFRIIRNNAVYKATPVNPEDAKSALEFAEKFISKTKILLKQQNERP